MINSNQDDHSGLPQSINSISFDTLVSSCISEVMFFIIFAVSGGPWWISKPRDILLLECCKVTEEWEGSTADPKASEGLSLGLSLLSGSLINGAYVLC